MLLSTNRLTIYAGPSLALTDSTLKEIVKPPIRRGDLELLLQTSHPGIIVILDGIYGSNLAITPTECREAIKAGWRLIGGCSMGALRASELWPVGMIGHGDIYSLFRVGKLHSDADVAVSYTKSMQEELTLSIVHIRYVLSVLCCQNEMNVARARRLLLLAKEIPWFERFPNLLLEHWKLNKVAVTTLEKAETLFSNPNYHPKKRDAKYIISLLTQSLWPLTYTSYGEENGK
jgi:hypothetical protein